MASTISGLSGYVPPAGTPYGLGQMLSTIPLSAFGNASDKRVVNLVGHGGEESALREFPPAVLIRASQVCHPYRLRCAWRKWRRVAPLVGRWRKALLVLHDEVAHRPGNSGMRAAMDEFAACAQGAEG